MGSKTIANGLYYERLTDLSDKYTTMSLDKPYKYIKSTDYDYVFIQANRGGLFNYMKDKMNHKIPHAHGCKQPDECYINEKNNTIIIIEKKFQNCNGSVCEKIQSPDFKLWQYKRLFPTYKIKYVYCLSDWFMYNCSAELEYLNYKNIPVFWGDDEDYKSKLIEFIIKS